MGRWPAVSGNYKYKVLGDGYPVTMVSWNQAREFVAELNRKEGTALYRLPTEAEWEYSCRAGSSAPFCFGDDETLLSEYAWYRDHRTERVGADGTKTLMSPVGLLKPNAWGLYDMHGNVMQWCQDSYSIPSGGDVTDPVSDDGNLRAVRGCSFYDAYFICRAAFRDHWDWDERTIYLGFRVARSAE